jgi:DNA-binding NtrC family response regulator
MARAPSPPAPQPRRACDWRARLPQAGLGGDASVIVPLLSRMGSRLKGEAMDPELWAERPLVLLAEDEAIIAIDLEDSLTAAGFAVAGPFATNAEVRIWLQAGRPDVAILDHALKDGLCDALVRDLARRGVPAIIFTGHDAEREWSSDLSTATWVTKPIAFKTLLGKIRGVLRASGEPAPGSANPRNTS